MVSADRYCEAEALFHAHGQRGEKPNGPWQALNDSPMREGLDPFHRPLGIKLDQNPDGSATTYSASIRCDAFDGFPCAINAKADAQIIWLDHPDDRHAHGIPHRHPRQAGRAVGRPLRRAGP